MEVWKLNKCEVCQVEFDENDEKQLAEHKHESENKEAQQQTG